MRSFSRDHGIGEGGREGSTLQQEVRVCRATGDRKNSPRLTSPRLVLRREMNESAIMSSYRRRALTVLPYNYDARISVRDRRAVRQNYSLSISLSGRRDRLLQSDRSKFKLGRTDVS